MSTYTSVIYGLQITSEMKPFIECEGKTKTNYCCSCKTEDNKTKYCPQCGSEIKKQHVEQLYKPNPFLFKNASYTWKDEPFLYELFDESNTSLDFIRHGDQENYIIGTELVSIESCESYSVIPSLTHKDKNDTLKKLEKIFFFKKEDVSLFIVNEGDIR